MTQSESPSPRHIPIPAKGFTARELDGLLHTWQSRFTGGRSPTTVGLAVLDWIAHAGNAPFQSAALGADAGVQWLRLARAAAMGETVIAASADDHRFSHPAWSRAPFSLLVQSTLLREEWWERMLAAPTGVERGNDRIVAFSVKQWLDLVSPSNMPWLNPQVMDATRDSGGANLAAGLDNYLRDQWSGTGAVAKAGFVVGETLAATPGKVVFQNKLIELIQYAPTTTEVAPEPILIVPAWIMKYYILDLSPQNSLIGWLVAQGHTVFAISWRNPGAEMRDTALDDYRTEGVMAAMDAITVICGGAKIHATGYCLGGTLLAIAAAAMAAVDDDRIASLSLFAAQTDFTEAGELQLFITEDQLEILNDIMQTQGYLDSARMGAAFAMLQANQLVWSHAIHSYMLGEPDTPNDLMAWNADGTRLPARMHIEYLRKLFLNNDLAEGRFEVVGHALALADINAPIFIVGTEHDQIAPWKSVFKFHLQNSGEITFVLTSGGHNAGIVSEPGHPHRHFRIRLREPGGHTVGPEDWVSGTDPQDGSWWIEWDRWLKTRSGAAETPPPMGAPSLRPLRDAPGLYVLET
jgi:polyhydroxyalkanoate synthase